MEYDLADRMISAGRSRLTDIDMYCRLYFFGVKQIDNQLK